MRLIDATRGMLLAVMVGVLLGVTPLALAGEPDYVIHISVDGLRGDAVPTLGQSELPNFYRFRTQGVYTDNARTDYDYTVTLPNHTSQVTGRGVVGSAGHNWTTNGYSPSSTTIHSNKGSYVASVFDVAHDNGLRTSVYATKSKFSLFDVSYNSTHGAPDTTGADNGNDKIDTFVYEDNPATLINSYISAMQANPYDYSFVHLRNPDSAGHSHNWSLNHNSDYMDAVRTVDGYLGLVFQMIENSSTLAGHTAVILTADHGGMIGTTNHGVASNPQDYTIPFYVWGAGVGTGDLYALNGDTRTDPGTGRPNYGGDPSAQPIRNGDAANLALDLLRLGPIPGSTIDAAQDLGVGAATAPEPSTSAAMLLLGGLALAWRAGRTSSVEREQN